MVELLEARSIKELKTEIQICLSRNKDYDAVAISHCNVAKTGPMGGFNLWNALVIFKKKS